MTVRAAEPAADEPGFFAELRASGALVRLRFSELHPGQVTGYSVALPGHVRDDGELAWYGGGRLAESLSLPRLRRRWGTGPERSADPERGAPRCSVAERNLIYEHAARQAAATADHIRLHAVGDPALTADAVHATADALHILARLTRNPALRQAADAYDRAARTAHGRVPQATADGTRLRASARLLALTGGSATGSAGQLAALAVQLAMLADAVSELRRCQQHAAQAAAARVSAERLREASTRLAIPAGSLDLAAARRLAPPTRYRPGAGARLPGQSASGSPRRGQ